MLRVGVDNNVERLHSNRSEVIRQGIDLMNERLGKKQKETALLAKVQPLPTLRGIITMDYIKELYYNKLETADESFTKALPCFPFPARIP